MSNTLFSFSWSCSSTGVPCFLFFVPTSPRPSFYSPPSPPLFLFPCSSSLAVHPRSHGCIRGTGGRGGRGGSEVEEGNVVINDFPGQRSCVLFSGGILDARYNVCFL
ncbi:hypothetical protein E2C01_095234 [Portunus trituberculatus]|uniref:Uncharacterized protein n=1 Tax=Portunus trituberculatus TaxID=210409 RepID=A0A5B7JZN3_PORTR|nr:hypothetical protein [Portunus trituberculatus]